MNHFVVIRDFKGDDALDEFSYFIVHYIPSRPRFSTEMLPNFLLTFLKFIIILQILFYPNFLPSFAILVPYKGSEIQGCYR